MTSHSDTGPTQKCRVCDNTLPLTSFPFSGKNVYRRKECRECRKEQKIQRTLREQNRAFNDIVRRIAVPR